MTNKKQKRRLAELKILSEGDLEEIYQTVLKILEKVGIEFHSQEALDVLGKAGACIEGNLVKIPSKLVEDALKTAPSQFSLYNREMTDSFMWGGDSICLGAGGSAILMLDEDGKTYREPQTSDLLNLFKIVDALPEISWMAPGLIVKDVPMDIVGVWRFYLRLKYGSKPSCADGLSHEDLMDNLELLKIVRNNEKDFYEKPFSQVESCSTPPLKWTNEGTSFLIEGARAKLPIVFIPMPFAGAAGPVTIAGLIAQHVAEALSGLVLIQQISPGIPGVLAGAPAYMDMKTGAIVLSPMEVTMINMAYTQMGRFYNIPTGTGDSAGHSDSKLNDFQSGAESASSQLLVSLAGNNAPLGVGFLANQEGYSLEKLVADCEIFKFIKKLLGGVDVSDETLAYEVFKEVGPGGSFLTHEHTLKWFKKVYNFSDVFDRNTRKDWKASGCKDTHALARERVKEILANTSFNRLNPEVDRALDRKMDSILKCRGFKLSDFKSLLPSD